jgi:hypothetical protein
VQTDQESERGIVNGQRDDQEGAGGRHRLELNCERCAREKEHEQDEPSSVWHVQQPSPASMTDDQADGLMF